MVSKWGSVTCGITDAREWIRLDLRWGTVAGAVEGQRLQTRTGGYWSEVVDLAPTAQGRVGTSVLRSFVF